MSHFTVAVFSDGTKTVEELLAPYQENNMGDCPKQYLEFHSMSEEYKEEYETGTTERVRLQDGTLVYPWSDILYRGITRAGYEVAKLDKTKKVKTEGFGRNVQYYVQDLQSLGAETVELPWKEIYPTFEQYLEEYHNCKKDEETLDYGYWENPDAKWDWWVIGGRWKGLLKAKEGNHGEISLLCPIPNEPGRYSQAKVKNIDFTPDKEEYEKHLRWWEVVMEDSPLRPGEDKSDFLNFYNKEYLIKRYKNKETYARIESSFTTYAVVLPDGTWYQKGQMGWFGCGSETADASYEWDMKYKENFIDKADPEWVLTIVDCHI